MNKIVISQKHIDSGCHKDSLYCPIALATLDAIKLNGNKYKNVVYRGSDIYGRPAVDRFQCDIERSKGKPYTLYSLMLFNRDKKAKNRMIFIHLDSEVSQWISDFDNYIHVEPIEIDLIDRLVKTYGVISKQ